jgi:hypothetical protein
MSAGNDRLVTWLSFGEISIRTRRNTWNFGENIGENTVDVWREYWRKLQYSMGKNNQD